MKKIFTTVFAVATAIIAMGQTVSPANSNVLLTGEGFSQNRLYCVGTNYATYQAAIWSIADGRVVNIATDDEDADQSLHAVSNNGLAVGSYKDFAAKADMNGNFTELYADKGEFVETSWGGYWSKESGSDAWAITPDGSVIVGDYYDADYVTTPCIWLNGGTTRVELPMPNAEEVPFEFDGSGARWVSDDGSIILGYLNDNYGTWPMVYWKKNAQGEYEVHAECVKYYEEDPGNEKPYMYFCPDGLSANGEWATLIVCHEYDAWNWEDPVMGCARINLVTGEIDELIDADNTFEMTAISNDGTCVGFRDSGSMYGREAAIWYKNQQLPNMIADLLPDNEYIQSLTGSECCNTPVYISADGAFIGGFGISEAEYDMTSYIMEAPEEVTAINDLTTVGSKAKAHKTIENGEIIIVKDNERYNVMGQKK